MHERRLAFGSLSLSLTLDQLDHARKKNANHDQDYGRWRLVAHGKGRANHDVGPERDRIGRVVPKPSG